MKIMKSGLLLFVLFVSADTFGQKTKMLSDTLYNQEDLYEDDPYFWSHTREIGVNFTPLLSKLIPFNLGENNAGLIGFVWKKYYATRAFRVNLGANIRSEFSNDNFFYLSIGTEKRYPMSKDKKFFYTSSWDLFASFEDSNDNAIIGISKGYGFEYHPSKRIFLSTEAQLQVGIDDDDGLIINFISPLAIFVNIRLY